MEEMGKGKTICIFLVSGKTFTFKGCYQIIDNESVLSFMYKAMSDSELKKGTFYKNYGTIVGYSIF